MKGKIPFTDEQLAAMKVSYIVGASLEALGFEFGVDKMVVSRRLKWMGVQLRPRGCPIGHRKPSERQRAKDLFAGGMNKHQISKEMHVCLRTVYRYLES